MGGSVIPGGIGLDEARHDEAPQPPAPAGAIMSGIAPEPGPAPPPEAAVSPDAAVAAGVPASPPGDGGQTVVLVSPDEGVALDRSWATGGTIAVTLVRDGADLRIDYGNPGSVLLAGFFAAAGGPALGGGGGAPAGPPPAPPPSAPGGGCRAASGRTRPPRARPRAAADSLGGRADGTRLA